MYDFIPYSLKIHFSRNVTVRHVERIAINSG